MRPRAPAAQRRVWPEQQRRSTGWGRSPPDRPRIWPDASKRQALSLARASLSSEAFALVWAEGQALSLNEATDLALAELDRLTSGLTTADGPW